MSALAGRAIEHPLGAAGMVRVGLHDGQVRVIGVGGQMVRIHGDRDSLERLRIESDRGQLSISHPEPRFGLPIPGLRAAPGPDLQVEVPRDCAVRIQTTSAEIATVGLTGRQDHRTVSGDITIADGAGSIAAQSVSGDIRIDGRASLGVVARTVSGDLAARAVRIERLEVTTMSGDVRARGSLPGPGPYQVQTVSGDFHLWTGTDVRIDARTVTGPGRPGGDERQRDRPTDRLPVRAGEVVATFRSMSGDWRLRSLDTPDVPEPPDAPVPPDAPEPPQWPQTAKPIEQLPQSSQLAILRALERGEIDVDEATARLAAEEADDGR